LVRCSSVCGSRSDETGTASAAAISAGGEVADEQRLLAEAGLDRLPGSIAERSTSVDDCASTSADGFIELISGSTVRRPAHAGERDRGAYWR
jgi:hypothetical protein